MPLLTSKPHPQLEVRIKVPLPLSTITPSYTSYSPSTATSIEILSSKTREEKRTIDTKSRRPSHSHSHSTSTSTSSASAITWLDDGEQGERFTERRGSRDTNSMRSRRKSSVTTVDGDFHPKRRLSTLGNGVGAGKKSVLIVRG